MSSIFPCDEWVYCLLGRVALGVSSNPGGTKETEDGQGKKIKEKGEEAQGWIEFKVDGRVFWGTTASLGELLT